MADNYRRIITTVSQASPSPSTDSSSHSFERPVVDDMLHRAVEGLRHLDPSRADQYVHTYEYLSEIPSGVVGDAETVFIQHYEDGRVETNPTKKKSLTLGNGRSVSEKAPPSVPAAMQRRRPSGGVDPLMKKRAKEEDGLSSVDPPRRARSGGRSRQPTEESEESRGGDQGSDDTLPPMAGPSARNGPGYPP
ncbi:hypothetical protein FRC09_016810 [Ceratobasidium sp. 395]|nr:hypothetical protein FRC09_016810 [Ceratobasidium sp. 395]